MSSSNIWNPWHGCVKISEGCEHCYMYFLDRVRADRDGSEFYKCKGNFNLPMKRDRQKNFKIRPGETLRVCMTSDFFLNQADDLRPEVWDMIRYRSDVVFFLLTKRADRIAQCLPPDWGGGWDNVFLNVTTENQRRADERIPILLDIPAKHKGLLCAPLIGPVDLSAYLPAMQIEQVIITGENYDGPRPCDDAWVRKIYEDCVKYNTRCHFTETGTILVKDGVVYTQPSLSDQAKYALWSPYHFEGRPIEFKLRMPETGEPIPAESRHVRRFSRHCITCASQFTCNGCNGCNNCKVFDGFIDPKYMQTGPSPSYQF